MSHTRIQTCTMTDLDCLKSACAKLGYTVRENATVKFFDGSTRQGTAVQIPGWRYPVVIAGQEAHYDNYGGSWGDIALFHKLEQRYALDVATKQAIAQGFTVQEFAAENGAIKLVASEGGATW